MARKLNAGMNRSEEADRSREKQRALQSTYREVRDGVTHKVNGLATVVWCCTVCRSMTEAPKVTQAIRREAFCSRCGEETEQERV